MLDAVAGRRRRQGRDHRVRPRRPALARDRRDAARLVLEELRGHDAILLGAVGDPSVPPRRPRARPAAAAALRARPPRQPAPGAALPRRRRHRWPATRRHRLRRRPRGHRGPVRRQRRRRCARGTPHEVATEVSLNTAYGVERVVRDAFGRAQARPRKQLTLVHKTNVLVHAGRPVDAHRRARSRPSSPTSRTDYLHVDAASMFFVTHPERFDVIVTDNLFGDILTDLARGDRRRHRPGRQRQPRRQPAPTRRCSSPCTARPRTSPARARPTRPRRSCPSRMLLDHLGLAEAAARGSRRRSPPTSPSAGHPPRPTPAGRRRASPAE